MAESAFCKSCGHTKTDHYHNFIAGTACRIKGCTCQKFVGKMILFTSWNEVSEVLDQPAEQVDTQGDAAYWRARAEKMEKAAALLADNLITAESILRKVREWGHLLDMITAYFDNLGGTGEAFFATLEKEEEEERHAPKTE